MRFSLLCSTNQNWSELLEEARHAESQGWDGLWVTDHFMGTTDRPMSSRERSPQEALALLGGLAAAVPRVRLGSLVLGAGYRHPAVLANAIATIDHISGGRVVLGIGAGWQESEHAAYGIPLLGTAERLQRFEEACEVLRRLLDGGDVDLDGSYFQLTRAFVEPRPIQAHLPLLVGGGGERRTLRIAARWADEWNSWGTPERIAQKGAVLDHWCDRVGRDPSTIVRTATVAFIVSEDEDRLHQFRGEPMRQPTIVGTHEEAAEAIRGYAEAGVTEVIVSDMTLGSGTRRTDAMDLFSERVAERFR